MQTIYEEELDALEVRLIAEEAARYLIYKQAFDDGISQAQARAAQAETERDVIWIAQTFIGTGLAVYGIYRGDAGTALTGIAMTASGGIRLIIALK